LSEKLINGLDNHSFGYFFLSKDSTVLNRIFKIKFPCLPKLLSYLLLLETGTHLKSLMMIKERIYLFIPWIRIFSSGLGKVFRKTYHTLSKSTSWRKKISQQAKWDKSL